METVKNTQKQMEKSLRFQDPIVIGSAALMLGYVIGTGRWNWVLQNTGKITEDLGTLALHYFAQSFQKFNPEIQKSLKGRVTH